MSHIDPAVDPPSHTVKMGENATFHCTGSAMLVLWTINKDHINVPELPLHYIERGFVLQEDDSGLMRNLTILALEYNNNTEVWCRIITTGGAGQALKSNRAIFTVIGK